MITSCVTKPNILVKTMVKTVKILKPEEKPIFPGCRELLSVSGKNIELPEIYFTSHSLRCSKRGLYHRLALK